MGKPIANVITVNFDDVAVLPCETCGKSGSSRQQFTHQGVRLCYLCAAQRAVELATEGHEPTCDCGHCMFLFFAHGNRN